MQYHHVNYEALRAFCVKVFQGYGFNEEQSGQISDVLLAADLSGIESHGIQRLIRYHKEITSGMVKLEAKPEIVFETPLSAVIEGNDCMGQILGVQAMQLAIDKAKKSGFGMVTVRNSNHYGIAGYYTKMAAEQGLIGMSMTNTEAIMVPTFGKQAMLGTNPIAFAMPADPVNFSFDAATTVVPRGKLEVYVKRGNGLPIGWALDENGHDSDEPDRVLSNIINKTGGGILPLGGSGDLTSGYKGYGFAMFVELLSAILQDGSYGKALTGKGADGKPAPFHLGHFFIAIDTDHFLGEDVCRKKAGDIIREVRGARKAPGAERIYSAGEKEYEIWQSRKDTGVPINESVQGEMSAVRDKLGLTQYVFPWEE